MIEVFQNYGKVSNFTPTSFDIRGFDTIENENVFMDAIKQNLFKFILTVNDDL